MYIKRRLRDDLSLFKGLRFPFKTASHSSHRYQTVVGIGGNIGDVKRRFEHLFYEIKRDKRLQLVETSLILKNPPFGYADQDDFFNSIMVIKTSMQPRAFLDYLMRLEKKFGRRRSFANAPRTLDLDIIFFDNRVIKSEKLTLPHPFWSNRESVIIPLSGVSL
ncbi:MAG: 2-amino-4-hydroxy-6-hydroxymethyldihydropteridine diphosphokinase [Campylobacterota bacterium]|nr:2-amino-4-hydroxy-6-hydroxymethyldihydropteridine diphosphokinase [Campylobacterota bacterium]